MAIRRLDGTVAVDLNPGSPGGHRSAPPLPVHPALGSVLPGGLRRGSTMAISGSVSLLLAVLGTASQSGAWCALVGFPRISAEAASEYGVDLSRLAIVPEPALLAKTGGWTTAVGALLDAVDVVALRLPRPNAGEGRPPRLVPGDVRRLVSRARTREAVLISYGDWPGADVRLTARNGEWSGIGDGFGRLRARRVEVTAEGRGAAARPRSAELWLPATGGGVEIATPLAPVIELAG